jgi:uncharacterized membrane protein YkoI
MIGKPQRMRTERVEEGEMNRRIRLLIGGTAAVVVIAGGAVAATAAGGDDDAPLTGHTRERAIAAALAHVGVGSVVGTEVGEDDAAYGVEIRLADGSQVEVTLDEGFRVIATEADDDGSEDGPSTDSDD